MSSCVGVHSHFFPTAILDTLRKDGARYGAPVTGDGRIVVVTPERAYGPLGPGFHDLDVRREFLARQGITTQIVSIGSGTARSPPSRPGCSGDDRLSRDGFGALPHLSDVLRGPWW